MELESSRNSSSAFHKQTNEQTRARTEIALDSTELDTYQLCEAKYNYRFNLQRVPQELSKPLDIGTLVHKGLEAYYKGLQAGLDFASSVDKALNAAKFAFTSSDLTSIEAERTLEVIEENLVYWQEADKRWEITRVENEFIYPLYEDDNFRISMTGKIDLSVSDNIYDNLPVDHKTYSRDYPLRRLSNQFINYANASHSNFVMINRIGLQTSLKPQDKHKRIMLTYDPIYIEQWRQNTIAWAMKYYESVVTNNWQMNLSSCDKFNRACEYLEVCDTTGNENKVYKLSTNFKQSDIWDISSTLVEK